jgi:predicted O-methyltransferase YrrM
MEYVQFFPLTPNTSMNTLLTDLPEKIDLLLLDGAKALYTDVLEMLEPHLRPGAFILADNADYCPSYMAYVSSPENGYMSVSVSEEVELSLRVG